jgi:hypothetical protein
MRVLGYGFLSAEGRATAAENSASFAGLLALLDEAVALCHQGIEAVDVSEQETEQGRQRIIACVVLVRLLEISEALGHLARGGFSVEVEACFRNFLEAFFIFGNVCKDAAFVTRYFNADLVARQTLANQAMKHSGQELFASIRDYATDEVRKALDAQVRSSGASRLDVFEFARGVDALHIYDSQYRVASAASHSSPRSLLGYLSSGDEHPISGVIRGPQVEGIPWRLCDAAQFLTNVRAAFDELFSTDASFDVERLRRSIESASLPDTPGPHKAT